MRIGYCLRGSWLPVSFYSSSSSFIMETVPDLW
jgi:hypothetical protein